MWLQLSKTHTLDVSRVLWRPSVSALCSFTIISVDNPHPPVLYPSTWRDHLRYLCAASVNEFQPSDQHIKAQIGTHPANWALPVTTAVSKPVLIRQTLGMIHTKTQVTYQHLSRQMAFKTIPVMIFCFPVLQKIQNNFVWHFVSICND